MLWRRRRHRLSLRRKTEEGFFSVLLPITKSSSFPCCGCASMPYGLPPSLACCPTANRRARKGLKEGRGAFFPMHTARTDGRKGSPLPRDFGWDSPLPPLAHLLCLSIWMEKGIRPLEEEEGRRGGRQRFSPTAASLSLKSPPPPAMPYEGRLAAVLRWD